MLVQTRSSIVETLSHHRVIPIVESRPQFLAALKTQPYQVILVRNCDLFDMRSLCQQAAYHGDAVFVNIDHIAGIHADAAGIHYLAEHLHITGIISSNMKVLQLGKAADLSTMLHIYAADSAGLESALDGIDTTAVDLLDVSPALVVPYITPALADTLPCPFIASGLISHRKHMQAVLRAGALGVAVLQPELW